METLPNGDDTSLSAAEKADVFENTLSAFSSKSGPNSIGASGGVEKLAYSVIELSLLARTG